MKNVLYLVVALAALFVGVYTHQANQTDFTTLENQAYHWKNNQQKWTVVNYFAKWCAPCLREIPELNHFYQQHQQQINLFAVSFDPLSREQLLDLKQQYAISFPIITHFETMPWQQPPNSLPTTYILNPEGKVVKQLKGEQTAEQLFNAITYLKTL